MDFKAEYDTETNILYNKFIGTPSSVEDAEFIARKSLEWYKKGNGFKVWQIFN